MSAEPKPITYIPVKAFLNPLLKVSFIPHTILLCVYLTSPRILRSISGFSTSNNLTLSQRELMGFERLERTIPD